jgi:hypothetical protein
MYSINSSWVYLSMPLSPTNASYISSSAFSDAVRAIATSVGGIETVENGRSPPPACAYGHT